MKTLIALGLITVSAHAGMIAIDSQPGLTNSLTAGTVAVSLHPAWQSNNPGGSQAVWISHSPTGFGDSEFQPFMGTTPVMSVYHDFIADAAGLLDLRVWADDTAEVLLDGVSLFAPDFSQFICATRPIGCLPSLAGVISTAFGPGFHTLELRVFQVGSGTNNVLNPFGLLYSGTATWQDPRVETPEPAAISLIGLGLIGIGVWGRKRV